MADKTSEDRMIELIDALEEVINEADVTTLEAIGALEGLKQFIVINHIQKKKEETNGNSDNG